MNGTPSVESPRTTRYGMSLLVALTLAASAAAEPATLDLVQTIPLEGVAGRLDHLALDSKGKREWH